MGMSYCQVITIVIQLNLNCANSVVTDPFGITKVATFGSLSSVDI